MVDKAKGVTHSSFPIYKQHGLKGKKFIDLETDHIMKNKFRGIYIVQTNLSSKETQLQLFYILTEIFLLLSSNI